MAGVLNLREEKKSLDMVVTGEVREGDGVLLVGWDGDG